MDGLVVSLTDKGSFELSNGRLSAVVSYDPDSPERPWSLCSSIEGGSEPSESEALAIFGALDDALKAMVDLIYGDRNWVRFMVQLPCGASFTRPGRVPAENVMASLGWVHVKTLVTHVVKAYHSDYSSDDVAEMFQASLLDEEIEVGYAVIVGAFRDENHWCIDLRRDSHQFLRYEHLGRSVSQAFQSIMNENNPIFDFVPTFPIRKSSAEIVSFGERTMAVA